jgi:hypothetical protein
MAHFALYVVRSVNELVTEKQNVETGRNGKRGRSAQDQVVFASLAQRAIAERGRDNRQESCADGQARRLTRGEYYQTAWMASLISPWT